MFEGIRKLPPATTLIVENGREVLIRVRGLAKKVIHGYLEAAKPE